MNQEDEAVIGCARKLAAEKGIETEAMSARAVRTGAEWSVTFLEKNRSELTRGGGVLVVVRDSPCQLVRIEVMQ